MISRVQIIEFFGIPGSGKTTMKNELIKKLKNKNKNVLDGNEAVNVSRKSRFLRIIIFLICNLISIIKIIRNYGFNQFYLKQFYYFEKLRKTIILHL